MTNNGAVCVMVKADGYGHGLTDVARILSIEAGNTGRRDLLLFGTATAEEALTLRAAGIENGILIVGGLQKEYAESLIRTGVVSTALDAEDAEVLGAAAKKLGMPAYAHIKLDTGMNRLGLSDRKGLARTLTAFSRQNGLILSGAFTHYATADGNIDYLEYQYAQFCGMLKALKKSIGRVKYGGLTIHSANSGALLTDKKYHMGMVRAGLAIYGFGRGARGESLHLKPAMSVSTRIVQVKNIPAGEYIGYGNNYRLSRDSLVAVIRAGYGDGYKRALSNLGKVSVNGALCPVIGNVCMDLLMADVTGVTPPAEKGGTAYLINEAVTAAGLAESCGTITYDILTSFSRRANRDIINRYYTPGQALDPSPAAASAARPRGITPICLLLE